MVFQVVVFHTRTPPLFIAYQLVRIPGSTSLLQTLERIVYSIVEKDETTSLKESNNSSPVLLGTQKYALMRLLSAAVFLNSTSEDRARYATLTMSYISRLQREVIPHYTPLDVTLNVIPPVISGPMAAGMSPDAIKDPVARSAYQKAIEENRNNNLKNAMQRNLTVVISDLKADLLDFLQDTEKKCPDISNKVNALSERLKALGSDESK